MPDDLRPIDYASSKSTPRRVWYPIRIFAVVGLVILSLIFWVLRALEFALEPPPPGNGYVLDDPTRGDVGIIMILVGLLWLTTLIYLTRRKFRLREWH
jgi:hypothetical protein